MKVVAVAVLVVSAYFLYWGVLGLGQILFSGPSGTHVNKDEHTAITRMPIHAMHVAVVLVCVVGGGYGVRWGMSKLR